MKATTTVSTTFAATHDRHRVGVLVTLNGELSVARLPIKVALLLPTSPCEWFEGPLSELVGGAGSNRTSLPD